MKAWKEHQQKGRKIATCTECTRPIYSNESSDIVTIQPLKLRHRVCSSDRETRS